MCVTMLCVGGGGGGAVLTMTLCAARLPRPARECRRGGGGGGAATSTGRSSQQPEPAGVLPRPRRELLSGGTQLLHQRAVPHGCPPECDGQPPAGLPPQPRLRLPPAALSLKELLPAVPQLRYFSSASQSPRCSPCHPVHPSLTCPVPPSSVQVRHHTPPADMLRRGAAAGTGE